MALVRDVACNICEAFQPQVSSASFMAGPLAALSAPKPLLHDLSQDPLLDISDVQAARSRSTSPQAKRSKQARDIMDLKAHMVQVLELLAKQTGHTFGPVEEEILLKSHREHEVFWHVVALLPPRASAGGRSSRCRASQTQTVTRTVPVPTAPLGDLRYRQQATGPNRQAEGTQDMASPHTSITGGVFRASTLNSHPKLPCLSLGSPSRVPEGWQPQAPFSAQQLQ
ncbi:UNVERIFIED_CONTAM: hypothetical protein FKN15_004337 [Acipenser sinensis]